jgi:NAD(P) transhydrogenase
MLRKSYDVAIVGGGPVGVSAALKASSLRKTAILIDATPPKQFQFTGPTGLFSKALRDAAQRIDVKVLRNMGIGDVAIWAQVDELIGSIVRKCGRDNMQALTLARVPHLRGIGRLASADGSEVVVDVAFQRGGGGERVVCRKALLATGSRAVQLPCLDPGLYYGGSPSQPLRVFDSDSIKQLSFLPRSVAIVGGGIIAVEFARIFAALEARVTMVIRAQDLPSSLARVGIDRDIGLELQRDLQSAGVRILFETEVTSAAEQQREAADGGPAGGARGRGQAEKRRPLVIGLERKGGGTEQELHADVLFTATGRNACSRGLGLVEIAGDEALARNGDVVTGADLQTAAAGVYAAGDLVGAPQLASTGIKQAEAAIVSMFEHSPTRDEHEEVEDGGPSTGAVRGTATPPSEAPSELLRDAARFPVGIWTIPEVAFVGLTLDAARGAGVAAVEGVARYEDSIRGHVHSAGAGSRGGMRQLKLVVERAPPHVVIGVHIFGDDACELIHYGTTLVQGRKTLADTLALTYTAVTYHELFRLAALEALEALERLEWRRIYELATDTGTDTASRTQPGAVDRDAMADRLANRLESAGADSADAERVASLFRVRRYVDADHFVKVAQRAQSPPDGLSLADDPAGALP